MGTRWERHDNRAAEGSMRQRCAMAQRRQPNQRSRGAGCWKRGRHPPHLLSPQCATTRRLPTSTAVTAVVPSSRCCLLSSSQYCSSVSYKRGGGHAVAALPQTRRRLSWVGRLLPGVQRCWSPFWRPGSGQAGGRRRGRIPEQRRPANPNPNTAPPREPPLNTPPPHPLASPRTHPPPPCPGCAQTARGPAGS